MAAKAKSELEIDEFIARTRALNGTIVEGREPWHGIATAEAIRHYCYGTSDANPLWLDPDYAAASRHGRLLAPPAFLTSVRYPVRHGAGGADRLSSLIAEIEFVWHRRVYQDERLDAVARQTDVLDAHDRYGRRAVYVLSETEYRNHERDLLAVARSTTARVDQTPDELILDREIHRYSESELDRIRSALDSELPAGRQGPDMDTLRTDAKVAEIVRGPLTIGDMIAWQAANGPPYRSGVFAHRDNIAEPDMATVNPVTGWSVRKSQQHEDFLLASQRGMPAPFDNGVMRFAWVAPLLTNWMGDDGFLKRLRLSFDEPILYGDVTRYAANVEDCRKGPTGVTVRLQIVGTNQLGQINTRGDADVWLPSTPRNETVAIPAQETMQNPPDPEIAPGPDPGAMVEACSVRCPERSALLFGAESMSYLALNRQARSVARQLLDHGVTSGTLVALYVPHGPDLIVSMLAVLKVGAAYLPLDVSDPLERIQRQLDVAGTPYLLTPRSVPQNIAEYAREVISFPVPNQGKETGPADPPDRRWDPCLPAYVLFTSGSTEEPKGVTVSRGALGRYLRDLAQRLPVTAGDVYAHTASPGFSAGVRQTWLPLSVGATLCLMDDATRRDPVALWERMCRTGCTVWDTVPSYWAAALEMLRSWPRADATHEAGGPMVVLLTGESLPWTLVDDWRRHLPPDSRIFNLYSQTETAGTVAVFEVPSDSAEKPGQVPLGEPFGSAMLHLLDDRRQPVVEGIGELWVGGDRLASGYLGNQALTTERFLPDPFSTVNGSRLYRTGDRARRNEQGQLEFVDRNDRRVRVRGQRVELGEVEQAFHSLPEVADCVVVNDLTDQHEARLVAFCRSVEQRDLDSKKLREDAAGKLPVAAIPTRIIQVADFPRTTSGKLDRPALARMLAEDDAPESAVFDGETGTQRTLLEIWRRVLGRRHIGIRDDFFELGGSSLAAVRTFAEMGRQLGRHLPLATLYDSPTVEQLAAKLDGTVDTPVREWPTVVEIRQGTSGTPLFLVHGIAGNVLFYRGLAERLDRSIPIYALQPPSLDGRRHPVETIEAMAARYVADIRRIQPRGPYRLGGFSLGGLIAFEIAQQLVHSGETVALLAILDSREPLREGAEDSKPAGLTGAFGRRIRRGWRRRRKHLRKSVPASLRRLRFALYFALHRPLPTDLRPYYTAHLGGVARTRYRPKPYPGDVLLICTRTRRPRAEAGWGALSEGTLTCVGVRGKHKDIFSPHHVAELAGALQGHLPPEPTGV